MVCERVCTAVVYAIEPSRDRCHRNGVVWGGWYIALASQCVHWVAAGVKIHLSGRDLRVPLYILWNPS